jgi:hypothetical protein
MGLGIYEFMMPKPKKSCEYFVHLNGPLAPSNGGGCGTIYISKLRSDWRDVHIVLQEDLLALPT